MNFKEELEKQNAEYVDAWFKKNVDMGHLKATLLNSAKQGLSDASYDIKMGSFEHIRIHMDDIVDKLSKELGGVKVSKKPNVLATGFVPLIFRWGHE